MLLCKICLYLYVKDKHLLGLHTIKVKSKFSLKGGNLQYAKS
nr:MAG TPA: hypothetical protein [Caudoviricetes sp.]